MKRILNAIHHTHTHTTAISEQKKEYFKNHVGLLYITPFPNTINCVY